MPSWRPDPTFYPSARLAMEAEPEGLAYVATLNTADDPAPDAICVVDTDPNSAGTCQWCTRTTFPRTLWLMFSFARLDLSSIFTPPL